MTVSLITCDLGVTLEVVGGVSATALAFIFPAVCFLKLTSARDIRTTLPAYACAAFGTLVMVLSLILALRKAWTSAGEAKICV
jgi:solute carrier family 38 (sodium-coupled neutral amino acid transporter), member 11